VSRDDAMKVLAASGVAEDRFHHGLLTHDISLSTGRRISDLSLLSD